MLRYSNMTFYRISIKKSCFFLCLWTYRPQSEPGWTGWLLSHPASGRCRCPHQPGSDNPWSSQSHPCSYQSSSCISVKQGPNVNSLEHMILIKPMEAWRDKSFRVCAPLLLSDLSLWDGIIVEHVIDFGVSGDLVRLQPEANFAFLQQLHSQLWLQGDNWSERLRAKLREIGRCVTHTHE